MTLGQALSSKELPALTGLRAVFVALVVLYHAGLPLPGGLGVTGFFVLSGFLITWLLTKELDATGDISLRGFYWRRAMRIFPAYYAFLVLSIGTDLAVDDERILPAILPGLTYTLNYYNAANGHPPISIAHAWSLAIEEQFYLLWPAVMWLIARRSRAAIPWVLVGLILGVVAWRSYAWSVLRWGDAYAYNAFETRFDSLAIGCLLAVLAPKFRHVKGCWYSPLILAPLILLADAWWRYTVGFTLASLLIGFLILQMMSLSQHPVWKWIEAAPVRYIGTISYGIYLYHILGLAVGDKLGAEWLGIGVTIGMAAISYHKFEARFLRLKQGHALVPMKKQVGTT